ncbi:unnamed protein product [Darwinula stevensoni]|nr:unnamed protein product [Darwinula stevensoni]CAG0903655.1 unnamed protein product [Darwinula stevensoni]
MVKDVIHGVLIEELEGKVFSDKEVPSLCKSVAESITSKVKELGYERYKFCVNVLIGEQRGAGVQVGSRCLWDIDTDNYASDIFLNDSLFCVAAVFGIYSY